MNKPRLSCCIFVVSFPFLLISCSIQKQIARSAKADVLDTKALQAAHVGISIFEPGTNKFWFNYQGDKYFVPASNTKIPTCYAAMKYLGDSLKGILYIENDGGISIIPTGDPTFLHSDFINQPVLSFLQKTKKPLFIRTENWNDEPLGYGWSWDDYNSEYMAERSPMPVHGNTVQFSTQSLVQNWQLQYININWNISPSYFRPSTDSVFSLLTASPDTNSFRKFLIKRDRSNNLFRLARSSSKFFRQEVPFITDGVNTTLSILKKEYDIHFSEPQVMLVGNKYSKPQWQSIKSQPADSVLKPMMHRSDNFFAEQLLLMVSNERLGIMNDEKIIDTLLKTDFKDLPQQPRWVDGSGLSRYNLFTPQDLVAILNKIKNEFGIERIKVILPTGGEGTISNYYKADSGYIFGKTGTLSGVVAFSGFLYTKKGKLLIFSTLVNNHKASATEVRRAVEKFIQQIRENY